MSKDLIINEKKESGKEPSPLELFYKERKVKTEDRLNLSGKLIQIQDGIPTPWKNLNYMLSNNPNVALAYGRMTEIFGENHTGKTTMALQIAAYVQSMYGMPVGYIDAEKRVNTKLAVDLGMHEDLTLLRKPQSGEEAFEEIKSMIRAGFKLIIADSLAAFTPIAVVEGKAEDNHMALMARLCSEQFPVLQTMVDRYKCHIIFINQVRFMIKSYGDPEITTGGNAPQFYFSYRLKLTHPRKEKIEEKVSSLTVLQDLNDEADDDDVEEKEKKTTKETGKFVTVKVLKNSFASPQQKVKLKMRYGYGFEMTYSDQDFFKEINILDCGKSNAKTLSYNGKRFKKEDYDKIIASKHFKKKLNAMLPEVEFAGTEFEIEETEEKTEIEKPKKRGRKKKNG